MGYKGSHEGKAGVPDVIVHGWMGHKGYLDDAYSRGFELLGDIYRENMHVVTVYEEDLSSSSLALKDARIKELEALVVSLREEPKIDMDALADKVLDRIESRK